MKKALALLISLVLVVSLFTGCSGKDAAAKTGLGIVSSIAKSANVGEKDGLAEVDSTVAAVLVDKDGKILKCVLDVAQTKINFSAEGKVLTDLATEYRSKQELKEDYGMKGSSGIGKEWYEQANAFADYVTGKTLAEVKGIALTEGAPSDADLSSKVTVHISEMIAAIEKAVNNAQDLGAKASDKLGLGISTTIDKSKDVAEGADGLAQAYSYYSALTTNKDGKITSCAIDASQGKVNFDATGVVTTDLTVAPKSKQELKEDYGMKAKSGIGKEWYEQANSFAKYVTGKTLADVKGIALTDGAPSGADLSASVTVSVGDMIAVVEKAVGNAK